MAVETPAGPGPAAIGRRRRRPLEQVFILLLAAAAVVSILVTVGIVFTLVEEGVPFFADGDVSLWDFLTGTTWQPVNDLFGVWPLLAASLYIAAIAAVVAIPLGLGKPSTSGVRPRAGPQVGQARAGAAGRDADDRARLLRARLDHPGAAGPRDRRRDPALQRPRAGIVVGVLIRLISSLSEDAMRAVPNAMREGAYGVGATRRHVATRIVFPRPVRHHGRDRARALPGRRRDDGRHARSRHPAEPHPRTRPSRCRRSPPTSSRSPRARPPAAASRYQSIFAVGLLLFVVTLIINLVAVQFRAALPHRLPVAAVATETLLPVSGPPALAKKRLRPADAIFFGGVLAGPDLARGAGLAAGLDPHRGPSRPSTGSCPAHLDQRRAGGLQLVDPGHVRADGDHVRDRHPDRLRRGPLPREVRLISAAQLQSAARARERGCATCARAARRGLAVLIARASAGLARLWARIGPPINRVIDVNISNLAAVPSIIYGLLGLAAFVLIMELQRTRWPALTLALLVLPIIIIASREAIKAVPVSIEQGAMALGATLAGRLAAGLPRPCRGCSPAPSSRCRAPSARRPR